MLDSAKKLLGNTIKWACKPVVARQKSALDATGDRVALGIRKKTLVEDVGLPDEQARLIAALPDMHPSVADMVASNPRIRESLSKSFEQVLHVADAESNSEEDFVEKLTERIDEDDSVALHVLSAAPSATSEELRELLGKILAKDVDKRGSIEPSTVDVAQKLSSDNLRAFRELRRVAWVNTGAFDDSRSFVALVLPETLDPDDAVGLYAGLPSGSLRRFEELGLIHIANVIVRGNPETKGSQWYSIRNGDRILELEVVKEWIVPLGRVALTTEGQEILRLYMDEPFEASPAYFSLMLKYWQEKGFPTKAR